MKSPSISVLVIAFCLLLAGPLVAQTRQSQPYVSLQGSFVKPSQIAYSKGMRLTQAVTEVEGVTADAAFSYGAIFRHPNSGHSRLLEFNWQDIAKGKAKDIVLEPGDTVFMPALSMYKGGVPYHFSPAIFVNVDDGITKYHIPWLLRAHHIQFDDYTNGLIGYGVSVAEKDQQQTVRLIEADSQQRHYSIEIPSEHFLHLAPGIGSWQKRSLNAPYSQLLRQPDYRACTLFGKILRHKEVKRQVADCLICDIKLGPRTYLDSDGKEHTGYDVQVHVSTLHGLPADGFLYLQVWKDGKEVDYQRDMFITH